MYAGKAHRHDEDGRKLIERIFRVRESLKGGCFTDAIAGILYRAFCDTFAPVSIRGKEMIDSSFHLSAYGVLLWFFALPGTRGAQPPEARCAQYAQEAFEAQQKNLKEQCGLSGDRWSLDWGGHRNWCLSVPEANAQSESSARSADLARCTACNTYAQTAFEAQQKNLSRSCGFSGDRWSLNFADHRAWCMGAPSAAAEAETQARTADLAKCNQCDDYARQAVDAQQKNLGNQCGQSGDRWSLDFLGHQSWCIGAPQAFIDTEKNVRQAAISACIGVCAEYAASASAAQRENEAKGCGYAGDRWSENEAGHRSWCITASETSRNFETAERAKFIGICTASPNKISACQAYARNAVAQFEEDVRCGYRQRDDRRWHRNFQNHYQWCMAVDAGLPPEETKERDRELERCRGARREPVPVPPGERCAVSVIVRNNECRNLDGSPSEYLQSGEVSAQGCGQDVESARDRAKLSLQLGGMCLSDEDSPEPGCCTYVEEVREGCLCQQ